MGVSASYTPYIPVTALVAVTDLADLELHVPGAAGVVDESSRRPVRVERPHIEERVRSGQSRSILTIINQAVKLPRMGQAPVNMASHRATGTV